MANGLSGRRGIRLFRLFGIEVSLHWAWILVALYEINARQGEYSSAAWNAAEYLTLFLIVLMHEFGHALACRSVGGQAEHLLLWPLGGVAYVRAPQRPGAVLWSIVAGPLVNVLLLPVTLGLVMLARRHAFPVTPDLHHFLVMMFAINLVLLIFNLLPLYPLDGGQILRALLWFVVGRAWSLRIASVIGLVGAVAGGLWALSQQDIWLMAIAAYAIMRSWIALKQARAIAALGRLPRHESVHCPSCGTAPPAAPLWRCPCGQRFDTFQARAACPACGRRFEVTSCPHCGVATPFEQWPGVETLIPVASPIAARVTSDARLAPAAPAIGPTSFIESTLGQAAPASPALGLTPPEPGSAAP
jgi:Zn-dependent protease/RNA polymerase subunit RPABC4/transcription elongation factor Spt4